MVRPASFIYAPCPRRQDSLRANQLQPSPRMLFKITVLGDGGVGKTALTVQVSLSGRLSERPDASLPWRPSSRHTIRQLKTATGNNGWWTISLAYSRFWIRLARVSVDGPRVFQSSCQRSTLRCGINGYGKFFHALIDPSAIHIPLSHGSDGRADSQRW